MLLYTLIFLLYLFILLLFINFMCFQQGLERNKSDEKKEGRRQ